MFTNLAKLNPQSANGNENESGLRVTLDNEKCKVMGLDKCPKIGIKVLLSAVAYVDSASVNSTTAGNDMSVTFQITDLEITSASQSNDTAADALYGV